MKSNNAELSFSKDMFVNCSDSEPLMLSPSELINADMDNKSFFEAAFYSLKYRMPEKNEYDLWNDEINNSSSYDFQKKLLGHFGITTNSGQPEII